MGLFDDLKKIGKQAMDELQKEETKEGIKNFFNEVADAGKKIVNELEEKGVTVEEKKEEKVESVSVGTTSEPCIDKLLQVLNNSFPEYEVKTNYSPRELGASGKFMNYSVAVFKNGAPKLFIMIIGKTTCSHREYRWSKDFANELGVEMINFINHYPNEKSYIENRLKSYLR